MKLFYFLLSLLFSFASNSQVLTTKLHTNWDFRGLDTLGWMPATVPGTVHTDLFANGVIGDPFKDNNEIKQQWVELENWEYLTVFSVDKEFMGHEHQELFFKGLDTYADVYLNDSLILEANNMFRNWLVDVTGLINEDGNVLNIIFTSPINKNTEKAKAYLSLPGGSDTTDYPVAPFTRKAAYHFGWDWAPRFVTAGIWQDIELQSWSGFRILDGFIKIVDWDSTKAAVYHLEVVSDKEQVVQLELTGDAIKSELNLKKDTNYFNLYAKLENIELWWPNGSGEQPLYNLSAQLKSEFHHDKLEQRVGYRQIILINQPDSIGTSFYFKVNGKPLFMKGANYVPQDVFLPRVKPEDYKRLLTQVKDAGMNMLRVWGGGIYEKEIFYDLCDEYGILVWQDYMFANSLYPIDLEEFFWNVGAEIMEQTSRLSKHSCVALFCGNNEIEVAWKNWGWQKQYGYSKSDSSALWKNYDFMFNTFIDADATIYGDMIDYVSTSPQSNWGTPENFNHGSMHYWGVWHGDDDFSGFSQYVGRFMVEWGFQSFPDYELLKQYISLGQLSLDSEVMLNRQKSYIGNGKISEFMSQYALYGGPATNLTFKDYIFNSQWVQSLGYYQALKAHMSKQPHCMGTLLWQLNDCWPGPSWSIINYDGTPKGVYKNVKTLFLK